MRIIFLGSGAFGLPTLKTLIESGHDVALVISQPDRPAGRGRHLSPTPIADFSTQLGMTVLKTSNVNDPEVQAAIKAVIPELLVVIAFGQKISDALLRIAPYGGINLHASLLPAFRGAAPIQRAILSGHLNTGVSIIRVTSVMDGGEILGQAPTPIGESETAGELHDRLAEIGAPLMQQSIQSIADGNVRATIQNAVHISQAPKLSKDMDWVDFSQSAEQVSCRIRGLSPWPGCMADLLTAEGAVRTKVSLLKCRAANSIGQASQTGLVLTDLQIACGAGSIELLQLQPIGKRIMDMRSFINGYGVKPGWMFKSQG